MSKLSQASVVQGKPTNFFSKKPEVIVKELKEGKKRGRPALNDENKKSQKLSLMFSENQKKQISFALQKYIEERSGDVLFTPPSMNEFITKLIFTNPELIRLLSGNA
ncbi:MAG: hypothetical protein KC454_08925 [Flavobacteriales bacterium]|nr:hypothetical protein [Flavobacteriales bacterium]